MDTQVHLLSLVNAKNILNRNSSGGFTLLEMLVVIVAIGILSAIAVPSWLGFVNRQRTNMAQSTALSILRDAQSQAKRERVRWQACFWDDGNQVLAVVHRVGSSGRCQTTNGIPLIPGDYQTKTIGFTSTFTQNPSNYYRVQFNYDGSINGIGELGKITFKPANRNDTKRCVIVSTILGAMRTDKDSRCN